MDASPAVLLFLADGSFVQLDAHTGDPQWTVHLPGGSCTTATDTAALVPDFGSQQLVFATGVDEEEVGIDDDESGGGGTSHHSQGEARVATTRVKKFLMKTARTVANLAQTPSIVSADARTVMTTTTSSHVMEIDLDDGTVYDDSSEEAVAGRRLLLVVRNDFCISGRHRGETSVSTSTVKFSFLDVRKVLEHTTSQRMVTQRPAEPLLHFNIFVDGRIVVHSAESWEEEQLKEQLDESTAIWSDTMFTNIVSAFVVAGSTCEELPLAVADPLDPRGQGAYYFNPRNRFLYVRGDPEQDFMIEYTEDEPAVGFFSLDDEQQGSVDPAGSSSNVPSRGSLVPSNHGGLRVDRVHVTSNNPVRGLPRSPVTVQPPSPPELSQPPFLAHNFVVESLVAKGGGGVVFRARHKLAGVPYAIKLFPVVDDDEEAILREVRTHAQLDHPHIVRYHSCWLESTQSLLPLFELNNISMEQFFYNDSSTEDSSTSHGGFWSTCTSRNHSPTTMCGQHNRPFDSPVSPVDPSGVTNFPAAPGTVAIYRSSYSPQAPKTYPIMCIQMEYCSIGTLADFKRSFVQYDEGSTPLTPMPRHIIGQIVVQLVDALAYIHGKNFVHRDVKPDNVFVHSVSPLVVKLGDFGVCKASFGGSNVSVGEGQVFPSEPHTVGVGSPLYMSPEQMNGSQYDCSCDIFSLALTIYELYFAFTTKSEQIAVFNSARNGDLDEQLLERCPELKCVQKMLCTTPLHRASLMDVRKVFRRVMKENI